jgi:lysophospholipase L1-like esterase
VLRRLALILGGIFFAALLAELLLRSVYTIPEVANPLYSFHRSDPVLGWSAKPSVRMRFRRPDFDALIAQGPEGWRLAEPAPPPDPTRRVLFLGDSFTWGWGVSQGELFTDRLQQRLPDTAVFNRGVNGFGTSQEYLLLQQELATHTYDAVALMFFANDVGDNINPKRGRRPLFELEGDRLVPRNQPPKRLMNPVARFFKDHSRLFQLLDFYSSLVVRALDDDREPWRFGEERPVTPHPEKIHVDYRDLPGATITMRLLREMQRLARDHGSEFVIVYLPHHSEIADPGSAHPYVEAVHAMIRDVAARNGIPLVDLTQPFHERARSGHVVLYPHDEHWSPEGHRLAAEVLLHSPLFP